MKEPKIIQHAGISLDISRVKCFKLNQFSTISPTNILIVEFEPRAEFIWNPDTKQHEKHFFSDTAEVEFPNYEVARAYTNELEEIWQDYLDAQKSNKIESQLVNANV